jgi:hypothetical protein
MVCSWFNDTKDEEVNVFLNANLHDQKEVVHVVKQFILDCEQTLATLLSWKMVPPHVCVGRWKISMNGTMNINTTFQTKEKR